MITISLCMIVKNEEDVLARCLDSIKHAVDEIVIVDTGSTDCTKEIAAQYTDKVLDFTWIDDFGAARNFAYDQATMDYQMWLDADDVVAPAEAQKLLDLKESLPAGVDMVTMKYHTHLDAEGQPIHSSTRERLTLRRKHFRWLDPVHEHIPLTGKIFHSDIAITHRKPPHQGPPSTRNLDIYEGLVNRGKTLTPRQQYYFARELRDHMQFRRAAEMFTAFLDGSKGWLEDNISACLALAGCYQRLGHGDQVLPALTRSFRYDSPRAEICCELGYYYMRKQNYLTALNWFQVAARLDPPQSIGFVLEDCLGYIPQLESCVCCCKLERFQDARVYNELAATHRPDSAAVAHNRLYLDGILGDG